MDCWYAGGGRRRPGRPTGSTKISRDGPRVLQDMPMHAQDDFDVRISECVT